MRVRPFTDADWPAFESFAKRHFGFSHVPDRAFNEHWFRTDRTEGWAARVLEDNESQVVGVAMVIVVPAKFGDRQVPLAWISSMAVEERVRARGAGALLYFWIYKTFPLVGALSGNEQSAALNGRLGMEIPGTWMRRFIRVHDRRTANLCQRGQHVVAAAAAGIPEAGDTPRLECHLVGEVPADYEQLWQRVRQRLYCTTERDRKYLEWRYLSAPHVKYEVLQLRAGNVLHGLAVLRFQCTPEGTACRVLEAVIDEACAADGWAVVAAAAHRRGALFTDFMVIGTDQDRALRTAGFVLADSNTGLDAIPHLLSPVEHRQWSNTFHLGGALAKADRAWQRPDGIFFTKGDSDRDWPTMYDLARAAVAE